MIILFIIGLLIGAIAVIFALQNIVVVTVTFLSWQLEGFLSVIILLSIMAGIFVCLLIILPETITTTIKLRRLKKEVERLEEELRKQKELTLFAKHDIPTPETIEKIENGAIEVLAK